MRQLKTTNVSLFFAVIALLAGALSTPALAEEENKPVGMSGWKIGLSNSLYITAPANMSSGGVEWNPIPAYPFAPSGWSAQNDDVRVELVRGAVARFDDIKKAAFTRIGGDGSSGSAIKLDGYDGARFAKDGKTAIVSRQSTQAWGVVILSGSTPKAKAVADEVLYSIWLERVGKAEWKDRVVGYSWQAELPYEMEEASTVSKNTEYYRARWDDFSVETLKGGAYTSFDKTVESQIEQMKSRTDIQDVRVQRFSREFGFEAKERGHAAQIDFLRGTEPHRIYKVATVTGYGALFTTISLRPKNPEHLAWAHRILSTLRLAYGVPGDQYKPVKLSGQPLAFESETTFREPTGDDVLQTFIGNDESNFVFSLSQGQDVIIPLVGEMKGLGELTRDRMLKDFMKGVGLELTKAIILPYAAGAFPARRVRFEAENKDKRLFGDAVTILTAHQIYLPVFLTTTATNDKMPRLSSTLDWAFPAPTDWKLSAAGQGGFKVLLPQDVKPLAENDKWNVDVYRDGVVLRIEEKRQTFPDEIYLSLDGLTSGEKEDNPMENDYGALYLLKNRMEKNYGFHWARTGIGEAQGVVGWGSASDLSKMQDTIVLRNGTHVWVCELTWNPRDAKSRDTRDAILGSIRCDSSPITAPVTAPSTPAPSTPAPGEDETDDWGWGWW